MEQVVLVDDNNQEIGTADKATVHTANTPLHRGFSLFLFNSQKELLLTQRALTKKTFPGIWTNTVCGHPAPGETPVDAAKRRIREELGIIVQEVKEVAPYRYRFADQNGIVENEISLTSSTVIPNSSWSLRLAASITLSPGFGCPQTVLVQIPGKVFLVSARWVKRSSFWELKRNNEKPRCKGVFVVCTVALSTMPIS